MVTDEERLEIKLDKIFEEIKEMGKVIAVQEQKLREINHRMGDGQQRAVLSQEVIRNEMNKRLDTIDNSLAHKVDLEDYREALSDMREMLSKDRKMMVTISIILVTGSGLMANMEVMRKALMAIFGVH
jgi:hypothetical protein